MTDEEEEGLFRDIIDSSPEIQQAFEDAQIHLSKALDMVNRESVKKNSIVFQTLMVAVSIDDRTIYSATH
ncbi:MAG: hypothetical protein PHO03_01845 [Candidatus Omnitrophica bacterium]|nr:hypothetical protein [Candidatus Omnitrophota bacterium]